MKTDMSDNLFYYPSYPIHCYSEIEVKTILDLEKFDFYTGVVDTDTGFIREYVKEKNILHSPACIESEAVGIAFGAWLAGKKPLIYIQNLGLAHCIESLSSLIIPCKAVITFLINHRSTPEHHKIMGEIDEKILDLLKYSNYIYYKKEK